MTVYKIFLICLSLAGNVYLRAQDSLRISRCGSDLKEFYLNLDVMHKWQAGQHINWETGLPDNPGAATGIKTHCSAFVAAACKNQNIYILRPPQHRQELLANAQFDWLISSAARDYGWKQIKTDILYQAQRLANDGYLVLICAKNTDRHKPGHIAMVMPANISLSQLHSSGPVLIQASGKNSIDAQFKNSFRRHIVSWDPFEGEIVFFYNTQKIFCH